MDKRLEKRPPFSVGREGSFDRREKHGNFYVDAATGDGVVLCAASEVRNAVPEAGHVIN